MRTCKFLFFLLAAVIFISKFESDTPVAIYIGISSFIIFFILACSSEKWALILSGIFICTASSFGAGVLPLGILGFVVGRTLKSSRNPVSLPWFPPNVLDFGLIVFLFSLFSATLITFLYDFDLATLLTIFHNTGIIGFYKFLALNDLSWHFALLQIAVYAVAFLFLKELIRLLRKEGNQQALLNGLLSGVFFALLFLFFQINGIGGEFFSYARTPFWRALGRFSAGFSDPNAFGLVAIFLVPLFCFIGIRKKSTIHLALGLLLLCSVPWSGSRTFYLGIFFWLCYLFHRLTLKRLRKKEWGGRWIALSAAIVFLIALVLCGKPEINRVLRNEVSTPSFQRLLQSISWEHAEEMFSSRVIYSRLAYGVWKDKPFFGVGLGRFYHLQKDEAKELGILLRGWKDNANNFYLQILSEGGILGLGLILISFYFLLLALSPPKENLLERPASTVRFIKFSRVSFLIFAALLITGPHFSFDEIKFITMIIIALGLAEVKELAEARLTKSSFGLIAGVMLFALLGSIYTVPSKKVFGFYGIESGTDGKVFWSGEKGEIFLCPELDQNQVALESKALHPDIFNKPLNLIVSGFNPETNQQIFSENIKLADWEWHKFSFKRELPPTTKVLRVEFSVDRTWSPSQLAPEGDARWLGVMFKWPQDVCSK